MVSGAVKIAIYLAFYAGFLASSSLSTPGERIVDLGYARYRGNLTLPNTAAFLGIPFAEPPVGNRRFRAPVPLNTNRVRSESRGEIVGATEYPDFCIQGSTGNGDAGGAGSEDCLKVNVYAPADAQPGANLPVLVYIHGGAYAYGNPRNWPFDHWIQQAPHVVIVSVYYRLDSFGFLAHPAFAADPTLGDLNVGIKDQIEALRWVQKNIHAFGGDPSRVTINGESAGGSSIELHLVASGEDGLFHSAIAQSVFRAPLPTPEQEVPLFNFFATKAGCSRGTLPVKMACLRSASVSALARAQDATFNGAYNAFRPIVDGKLIKEYPTTSILNGRFRNVPLIVGACSNETYTGGPIETTLPQFYPQITQPDISQFESMYPLSDFDNSAQQQQVASGESEFICARAILGGAFAQKAKAFTYRYNQPVPGTGSNVVWHASENALFFLGTSTGFNGTTTFVPLSPTDTAFAEELIAYWLSFVRSGDPNTFKLERSPIWPEYTLASKSRIVLQEGTTNTSGSLVELEPGRESERCLFVSSKAMQQQN